MTTSVIQKGHSGDRPLDPTTLFWFLLKSTKTGVPSKKTHPFGHFLEVENKPGSFAILRRIRRICAEEPFYKVEPEFCVWSSSLALECTDFLRVKRTPLATPLLATCAIYIR